MICPQCGHANPTGVAVCAQCATPLVNFCPNCGFENPREFKFCGNCGTNLLTAKFARPSDSEQLRKVRGFIPADLVDKILNASKQIGGERRTVTVLFSDVVGFTAMSEKLDPETVFNIIDESVSLFREEIYAHEGTLDKFMGDGVMAMFGAPIAHEDDAARAVRCALGMQNAVKQINDKLYAEHGLSLQMRIGLNLGTVVVADIGKDLRMNYTALGDTVNVAARLQGVAEPGSILVSRTVYEETRALFEYSELGSIRVKGRVEPVDIYQVVGVKREPGRVRGVPGLTAPMVGRGTELETVQRVLESLARDKHGGIVLITGDAGMGKSRLTFELKEWMARMPALEALRAYEGGCVAYGQSAFDVFLQLLNELFGIQPEDPPAARGEKLKRRIQELTPERARSDILPYLEQLMGLPLTDRALAERIRHLDAAQLRQQTFLALRDVLLAAARVHPLVLILEDLHWVDKPSLDLLMFLLNTVEDAPIVWLCIARPGEGHATVQIQRLALATLNGQFQSVALEPLTPQASQELVDALLTMGDLPDSLRQMISQRAEGNPFYLEEIIRTLIDRNLIRRRGDHWEMTPDADIHAVQVPRTLEGLIMARVDHLPESTRYTAQCAAVIGRDFPDSILLRIADTNASRLDNDLQELMDHELVRQSPVQRPQLHTAHERVFAFRHILTQQTIYNSVLNRRREQLHFKIASAIEEVYADRLEEQAERLAFHYSESKDAGKALPHVIRAAERSASRFANEEALSYYRAAHDLATRVQAPTETRARILIGLGDSQTHVGDFDSAAASFRAAWDLTRTESASPTQARQAAEIARRLGRVFERRGRYDDAMQWLESALREINRDVTSGHAVERVRIYLDIGWVHYRRGNLDEALHWRLRALEISEGLDYYAEIGSAYNGLAALYNMKGDLPRAIEYAERGLQAREMIGDLDGVSRSHSNLGAIYLNLGEWAQALPHLERSLELKQRIGDAKQLALALNNLGFYSLYRGDLARANELFNAARKQAEKIRDPNATCLALNSLAQVDLLEGAADSAAALLQMSIELASSAGVRDWLAEAQALFAETELQRGNLAHARTVAQDALYLAQALGIRQTEGNALRVLGAAERATQEYDAAREHLTRSVALAHENSSPFEAARTQTELGLLYRDMHQSDAARNELQNSRDTFERLGADLYAERARQALAQLV